MISTTADWGAGVSGYGVRPNFQGGLVFRATNQCTNGTFSDGTLCPLVTLDGATGQVLSSYSPPGSNYNYGDFLVHPDGTIFNLELDGSANYVVSGIDPSTGTRKFTAMLWQWATGDGAAVGISNGVAYNSPLLGPHADPIVAGNSYAYWPWTRTVFTLTSFDDNGNPIGYYTEHLMLFRIDNNGNNDNIDVMDWISSTDRAYLGPTTDISITTDADQGVLVNWYTPGTGSGMAVVTGTSVAIVAAPVVPGEVTNVFNMLQAQDGSYIGTVGTGDPNNPQNNMVAFDATGNVRWVVQNDQPQIATADGGVIGQSGITYDSNGNATGQSGGFTTESWTLNAYQIGSVDQIWKKIVSIAQSWWLFKGGNASGNSSATHQPWYAPLESCPGKAAPCAQEAILSALAALKALLAGPCLGCDNLIFSHLAGKSRQDFLNNYLSLKPRLWDGTKFWVPQNVGFCKDSIYRQAFCAYGPSPVRMGMGDSDAKSQTPSDDGKGMQVFFNPSTGICLSWSVSNPPPGDQGVLNQAVLFHEALHGYTGDDDNSLEHAFSLPLTIGESASITYYIEGTTKNNLGLGGVIPGGASGAQSCH